LHASCQHDQFQQNVGHCQAVAVREPVTIAKNDRDDRVRCSAEVYSAISNGRIARCIGELDEGTIEAIGAAELLVAYAHPDGELTSS
jgi:hypothetical protein